MENHNDRMNPTVKAQWLAALRSGDYRQTTEFLCRRDDKGNDSFCCLGVLANLFAQQHPGTGFRMEASDRFNMTQVHRLNPGEVSLSFSLNHINLPPEIKEWAGIPNYHAELDKEFNERDIQGFLAGRNDNGWTFKGIAKLIEKYL